MQLKLGGGCRGIDRSFLGAPEGGSAEVRLLRGGKTLPGCPSAASLRRNMLQCNATASAALL